MLAVVGCVAIARKAPVAHCLPVRNAQAVEAGGAVAPAHPAPINHWAGRMVGAPVLAAVLGAVRQRRILKRIHTTTTCVHNASTVVHARAVEAGISWPATRAAQVGCGIAPPDAATIGVAVRPRVCVAVATVVSLVRPIAKPAAIDAGRTVAPAYPANIHRSTATPHPGAIWPTVIGDTRVTRAAAVHFAVAICHVGAIKA